MAIQLTKSDLIYKDYVEKHTKNDDPKLRGKPDSSLLSRTELYEMLYMINQFCIEHDFKQKSSGRKVEWLIRNKVPSDQRSQEHVRTWLIANWSKHDLPDNLK